MRDSGYWVVRMLLAVAGLMAVVAMWMLFMGITSHIERVRMPVDPIILNNAWSYRKLSPGVWVFTDSRTGDEYLSVEDAGLVHVTRRAER